MENNDDEGSNDYVLQHHLRMDHIWMQHNRDTTHGLHDNARQCVISWYDHLNEPIFGPPTPDQITRYMAALYESMEQDEVPIVVIQDSPLEFAIRIWVVCFDMLGYDDQEGILQWVGFDPQAAHSMMHLQDLPVDDDEGAAATDEEIEDD